MSRAYALTPHQEDQIWELWIMRVPQQAIAQRMGCSRTTVSNAVVRIRKRLNAHRLGELEEARCEALAEYDLIKREAWRRFVACAATSTAAVGYLGTIITARGAQDRLLGLEQITINHRAMVLDKVSDIMSSPVPIALPGSVIDGSTAAS